jgi:superfamily II DNA/RNA helicase
MKILLVKRLESSFYAFRMTLGRFIGSYDSFLSMLEKGTVYLSKKYSGQIYEALDSDDEDAIIRLVEEGKARKYESKRFEKSFWEDLEKDLSILAEIKQLWEGVDEDPKIEKFKDILKKDKILKDNKLIVFTESKETADYLHKNLKQIFGDTILSYSSQSSAVARDRITENFDPKYRKPKDDIRVLVTTDILAEGVNMHRSNVVINYDIPWNPTKVLQRVGRINRIDTAHDKIYVYNFFPTVQSNNEIKLEEAAIAKIQAFHDTLGEDAQYLTDGEEISSHELFNRLNSKKVIEEGGEGEEDSELKYLSEIRDVRDNKQDLYEKIKRLPKKARSARIYKEKPEAVITFFRKAKLRKIYIADSDESKEVDFFKAVEVFKATPTERREKLTPNFYKYLDANKDGFRLATTEEVREFKQAGGRSNEILLMRTIKSIEKFPGLTDDDEAYLTRVLKMLEEGMLPKQTTKLLAKAIKKESQKGGNPLKILYVFRKGIPEAFFSESVTGASFYGSSPREVILSELLIPQKT